MAIGPGKYDELCTYVRKQANASGAIVIVVDGESGSGMSLQLPLDLRSVIPDMLEQVAHQIRTSVHSQN